MSKALFLALRPPFLENLVFHGAGNKEESLLHLGTTVGCMGSTKHSRPGSELGSEAGAAHFLLRRGKTQAGPSGKEDVVLESPAARVGFRGSWRGATIRQGFGQLRETPPT